MSSITTPRHPARNQTIIVLDDDMNVYSEWHTNNDDPNAPRCWNCNKKRTKLFHLSENPVYHEDTGLTTLEMGCGRCHDREQDKRDSAARRIERQCKATVAKNKEFASRRRYNASLVQHALQEVKESQVGYKVVEKREDNMPDTTTSVETIVVPTTVQSSVLTEVQKSIASQLEALLRKQADLEAQLALSRNPTAAQQPQAAQAQVQQPQAAQVTTGPRSKRVITDDDGDTVMQTGETTHDQCAQAAQESQLSPYSQAVQEAERELSELDVTE